MNDLIQGIQFIEATNFEELSTITAEMMIDCVKHKPDALFCLASGNSPVRAFEIFVERVINENVDVRKLRILKLDEWWGIPATHPSTCENYMQTRIIQPLNISEENYISFNSAASDINTECKRITQLLQEHGGIDLCILGLGKNGHIGLNEPSAYLTPFTHAAKLDSKTKTHDLLSKTGTVLDYGMTIGIADIMASHKVIFLATGEGKSEIYKEFIKGQVRTDLPASILWLHPNTVCVFERQLLKSV